MSSERDSDTPSADERTTPSDILAVELEAARNELERPSSGLALSGLSAGLDVSFGPFLVVIVTALAAGVWSEPLVALASANAYAVGFIFVVLGGSELYTEHTTLAFLPVLDGTASLRELARLWGLVFGGNVVGSAAFAALAVWLGPAYGLADAATFTRVAEQVAGHAPLVTFAGAVLAGWLMGLLSWLVAAAQETISRAFAVWLVAGVIGLAHLPHCIAGTVEVFAAALAGSAFTFVDYLRFLVVSTLGNTAGGVVFVALLKYSHVVRGGA